MKLCWLFVFSGQYRPYLVEFVEGGHRRQVVDVYAYDFVAYLREHRIIELEERHLHPSALDLGRSDAPSRRRFRCRPTGFSPDPTTLPKLA